MLHVLAEQFVSEVLVMLNVVLVGPLVSHVVLAKELVVPHVMLAGKLVVS